MPKLRLERVRGDRWALAQDVLFEQALPKAVHFACQRKLELEVAAIAQAGGPHLLYGLLLQVSSPPGSAVVKP